MFASFPSCPYLSTKLNMRNIRWQLLLANDCVHLPNNSISLLRVSFLLPSSAQNIYMYFWFTFSIQQPEERDSLLSHTLLTGATSYRQQNWTTCSRENRNDNKEKKRSKDLSLLKTNTCLQLASLSAGVLIEAQELCSGSANTRLPCTCSAYHNYSSLSSSTYSLPAAC